MKPLHTYGTLLDLYALDQLVGDQIRVLVTTASTSPRGQKVPLKNINERVDSQFCYLLLRTGKVSSSQPNMMKTQRLNHLQLHLIR